MKLTAPCSATGALLCLLGLSACGGSTATLDGERGSAVEDSLGSSGDDASDRDPTETDRGASASEAELVPIGEDPGASDGADGSLAATDPARPLETASRSEPSSAGETPSVSDDPAPAEESAAAPIAPAPCTDLPTADEAEVARRLERLLWNGDGSEQRARLAAGELSLPDAGAVVAEARRMLDDPRAVAGSTAFVRSWLGLHGGVRFESPLSDSVLESTDRLIEGLVFGDDGREPGAVSSLFTGELAAIDATLAEFYGVDAPRSEWELSALPDARALGLLTQAEWLNLNPNAAWRGAAIRRSFLCTPIPQPPAGALALPDPASELTTREQFEMHTQSESCAACHTLLDPVGFGFEHFDIDGAYRGSDGGLPIDASGEFTDLRLAFTGTEGLAGLLTSELAEHVETCFVENVVRHAASGPGPAELASVASFAPGCFAVEGTPPDDGLDATLQEWFLAIVASPTFAAAH